MLIPTAIRARAAMCAPFHGGGRAALRCQRSAGAAVPSEARAAVRDVGAEDPGVGWSVRARTARLRRRLRSAPMIRFPSMRVVGESDEIRDRAVQRGGQLGKLRDIDSGASLEAGDGSVRGTQ